MKPFVRDLLCVLIGVVLATGVFEARATFQDFDARITRIENFLSAVYSGDGGGPHSQKVDR